VIRVVRPFKTPFNNTFSFGVDRRVVADVTVGATYLGRELRNILGVRETNLSVDSRTAGRVITTDGGPLQRSYGPWYDGVYHALVLTIQKPFDGRYEWQFSYTHAVGRDNVLNPNLAVGVATQGAGSAPTDNLDLGLDHGPSDLLTPHVVVASGAVGLSHNVIASGVLRGTSGNFFSASGTTKDYDGDGISSTRPVGTRRNEFTGPGYFDVDVRVEKRFTVGRYTASGLLEFFNLLNARNPKKVDNSYGTAPGPNFGTVITPYPGREAQLGVRVTF
jgi:hypothetical protein